MSGDWHFRADPFLLEAYREHGVEAVVYSLWRLLQKARLSFYFTPSLKLWNDSPSKEDAEPPSEIDALAVVDGKLVLCEAKTSSNLKPKDFNRLLSVAIKIRPDVISIVVMEKVSTRLRKNVQGFRTALPKGIEVEVVGFDPKVLENNILLPF